MFLNRNHHHQHRRAPTTASSVASRSFCSRHNHSPPVRTVSESSSSNNNNSCCPYREQRDNRPYSYSGVSGHSHYHRHRPPTPPPARVSPSPPFVPPLADNENSSRTDSRHQQHAPAINASTPNSRYNNYDRPVSLRAHAHHPHHNMRSSSLTARSVAVEAGVPYSSEWSLNADLYDDAADELSLSSSELGRKPPTRRSYDPCPCVSPYRNSTHRYDERQHHRHQRHQDHRFAESVPSLSSMSPTPPCHHEHQVPDTIEITPGVFVRLRGAQETQQAIQDSFIVPSTCLNCDISILCIADASFVICPDCKIVSPTCSLMESSVSLDYSGGESSTMAGGVGLGFKAQDMF